MHPTDQDRHYGTIFTYLPLPIHSGLPVHTNGAFAVTSNRRHLCERNEDGKKNFLLKNLKLHSVLRQMKSAGFNSVRKQKSLSAEGQPPLPRDGMGEESQVNRFEQVHMIVGVSHVVEGKCAHALVESQVPMW